MTKEINYEKAEAQFRLKRKEIAEAIFKILEDTFGKFAMPDLNKVVTTKEYFVHELYLFNLQSLFSSKIAVQPITLIFERLSSPYKYRLLMGDFSWQVSRILCDWDKDQKDEDQQEKLDIANKKLNDLMKHYSFTLYKIKRNEIVPVNFNFFDTIVGEITKTTVYIFNDNSIYYDSKEEAKKVLIADMQQEISRCQEKIRKFEHIIEDLQL